MKQRRMGAARSTAKKKSVKTTAPVPAGERGMDLSSLFGVAAQALAANQSTLNHADTENQNHGDNMVQAFNMITQALGSQGGTPTQQLNHASQYLAQNGHTGSAQVYSQGLAQAAQQMQGQPAVTPANAGMLIQALMGGEQASQQAGGAGDLLGSLLGGQGGGGADLLGSLLTGGAGSAPQQGAGDLLGSLLGGGGMPQQSTNQQDNGIDIGDVLNAGMTFMNAKQQGQSTLQAALSAIMATGPMGQKPYRQQSGQLVANALLQAIAGMQRR